MTIKLRPLPYAYDALEPGLIELILYFHHDKHLKTYVDNLNDLLKPYPELQTYSLEELIRRNRSLPVKIQQGVWNNAGGVYNHNLYFSIMGKTGRHQPQGALLQAINSAFGSFEAFRENFTAQALSVFGSGYAWLTADEQGKLSIAATRNQDTVLTYPVTPLMLVDVWEHAYYLQYQNRRAAYLKYWFDLINWEEVERRYQR